MSLDAILTDNWMDSLRFDDKGLVTVVAQDVYSQRVLMVAWMNCEALKETVRTGYATYFSRSRNKLWRKGEESGNQQRLHSIHLDCDGDTIVIKVEQEGGIACHTGRESCFFHILNQTTPSALKWDVADAVIKSSDQIYSRSDSQNLSSGNVLSALAQVIESRKSADPAQSYVAQLFHKGQDAILKKIGEESTELVMASKDQDVQHIIAETADVWFHSLILLASHQIAHEQVLAELAQRFGLSGIEEKTNRNATLAIRNK